MMKRFFIVILIGLVATSIYAYDFSITNSNGKVLYFRISSGNSVILCQPDLFTYNLDATMAYGEYEEKWFQENRGGFYPEQGDLWTIIQEYAGYLYIGNQVAYEGRIIVPETVEHNGTVYKVVGIDSFMSKTYIFGRSTQHLAEYSEKYGLPNDDRYNVGTISSNIESIEIPSGVTELESDVFYNQPNLKSITLPSTLSRIDGNTFYECPNIQEIYLYSERVPNVYDNYRFAPDVENAKLYVPKKSIELYKKDDAFGRIANILPISFEEDGICYNVISSTELTVEVTALKDGLSCGAIVIPEKVTFQGKTYSVTSIAGGAFGNQDFLESVSIPTTVTTIGDFAFSNCWRLSTVTIPSSVISIGKGVFSNCGGYFGLYSIKVETGNPKYDSRDNCNAIIETNTNILIAGCQGTTIPNSVTSIDSYAFSGCFDRTNVVIPNSVTNIGEYAFSGCSALTSITCEGTTPPAIDDYTFYDVPRTALVEVPYGSVSAYKSAEGWNNFTNIYTLGDANLSGTEPDVTDFNYTVNYILGEEPTGFFFTGADYNKNGVVNVIDAIAIGRLITNGTTVAQVKKFRAPAVDNNEYGLDILNTEDAIIAAGTEFTLPISITPDRYSSMQMDIQIPEGFSVVDVTNGTGAEGHSLFYGVHDDGVLRIMLGSLENTKMGEAPIVNITLAVADDLMDGQYDFNISNILAVTPELETVNGKALNANVSVGDATAIKGVNLSGLKLARTDGGISITSDSAQTIAIRSIDGKLIANEHVNAGEAKTLSLPAGIYIINNKKITVK